MNSFIEEMVILIIAATASLLALRCAWHIDGGSLFWPCHIFAVLTYVMCNRQKCDSDKNAIPLLCHNQMTGDSQSLGDSGIFKQYLIMLQLHEWSCCNCIIMLNCCQFSLVLFDHAATAWMIMLQLHRHAATSLVNPFVFKVRWGHVLCGYSLDQLYLFGLRIIIIIIFNNNIYFL